MHVSSCIWPSSSQWDCWKDVCVKALEEIWEKGEAILAPRVLDHPRVRSFEFLYSNNISSLAVIPLRIGGLPKGALYLNNPAVAHISPPSGSSVLLAYQNLLGLILPRPVSSDPRNSQTSFQQSH